jgi:hypothetical protein
MSALYRPDQLHFNPSTFVGHCTPGEAHAKHITQLGTSACGATAVVNVLVLLDATDKSHATRLDYSCCILRRRANDAPLPQYLRSRYDAGCTGEELVESMRRMLIQNRGRLNLPIPADNISCGTSAGGIECEFVSFRDILEQQEMKRQLEPHLHHPPQRYQTNDAYSQKHGQQQVQGLSSTSLLPASFLTASSKRYSSKLSQVSDVPTDSDSDRGEGSISKHGQQRLLSEYLTSRFQDHWVAIATMNLQVNGNDAWHHQIVYGLDREKDLLYMLNPFETCTLSEVVDYMSTESVLLIRQEDILSRVNRPNADTSIYEDPLWKPFNVGHQIEEMVMAASSGHADESTFPFVLIPAAYVGGFAFFRRKP